MQARPQTRLSEGTTGSGGERLSYEATLLACDVRINADVTPRRLREASVVSGALES